MTNKEFTSKTSRFFILNTFFILKNKVGQQVGNNLKS